MSFGVPIGIAGVGLIGGSIALRARAAGIEVVGFDREPIERSLVDAAAGSLEALAERARTLVLALPLDATLAAIDTLRRGDFPELDLVIDVASVKAPAVLRAQGWERFAGTHPIAGAERGGAASARSDLFSGRAWAYVPSDARRDAAVRAFIAAMGAHPVAVSAAAHDEVLALTSHLPQVVVSTLAAMLEEYALPGELRGPGLASTLRLAGSPWALWETILRANAPALSVALRELAERLAGVAQELEAGEVVRIPSYFEGANRAYEQFVRDSQEKGFRNR